MEKGDLKDLLDATVLRGAVETEVAKAEGHYYVECFDPDGNLKWRDDIKNVVCNQGKNYMLDLALANTGTYGAGFLGLISSVGYSTIVATDTISSHAGWQEAGNGVNYPLWTTPASNARGALTWAGATTGSKALSTAVSFVIGTPGGTVKGCFIVIGSGSVSTNNTGGGNLMSAGLFSGGDKVVGTGDTLNVSYSLAL